MDKLLEYLVVKDFGLTTHNSKAPLVEIMSGSLTRNISQM